MPAKQNSDRPAHIAGFWTDDRIKRLTHECHLLVNNANDNLLKLTGVRRARIADELAAALRTTEKRLHNAGLHQQEPQS